MVLLRFTKKKRVLVLLQNTKPECSGYIIIVPKRANFPRHYQFSTFFSLNGLEFRLSPIWLGKSKKARRANFFLKLPKTNSRNLFTLYKVLTLSQWKLYIDIKFYNIALPLSFLIKCLRVLFPNWKVCNKILSYLIFKNTVLLTKTKEWQVKK